MKNIYDNILKSISEGEKLLAILIDPDKMVFSQMPRFIKLVNASMATYIFVGGSEVDDNVTQKMVVELKKHTSLPVILFPGDVSQITKEADALLFLSLISGRNTEYLIGKHIKAVPKLNALSLEVIPTGYILIENGKETSVQKVTGTQPLGRENIQLITNTAKAGELLGMKLIYLEAGSGATHPVNAEIISSVKKLINIPLVVGGGIRSLSQLEDAYKSGADLVVIGTAFEENESFFDELR
jgi:putative glycerol-1-phosphate prenyltransferase